MRLICTKILSVTLFSISLISANAQNFFFKDIAETNIRRTDQKRVIIPNKFRTVQLDTTGFLAFLRLLPSEQNILNNRNSAPIFLLPMPDGSVARFRVWESSVMAPELAAAYPGIRTYTGQGIDDPTATIKLDWTEFGFHAMVLSPTTGSIFIDPYDQKTVLNYISYYKTDFNKKGSYYELPPRKRKEAAIQSRPTNVLEGACVGTQLRKYKLAVACTHEYAAIATGLPTPTKAETLAKIVTTVSRVSGIYEKELSIRLELVANETDIIFTTAATDPFTGNDNGEVLIDESQTVIDARIGNANYNIGHTFSTGAGGLAAVGVICLTGQKANGVTGSPTPTGDAYDVDYVAHEMGHQFGGDHTFNSEQDFCGGGNRSSTSNAEPASGSTIMAYAGICSPENLQNNSDPQFHAISFDQITEYAVNSSGNSCAVTTATGNSAPVVNAGVNYNIPLSTPFVLIGSATDANNDVLTYSWEQVDVNGPPGPWNLPSGDAPLFRSFPPVATPVRHFPKLSSQVNNSVLIGEILPSYGRTMHFRLTARDNKAAGGGVCYAQTAITSVAGTGPFKVSYPNLSSVVWNVNEFQTITWNPAGTINAPISCSNVNIQLSTDGGLTFPVSLIANTPNDGTEEIQVPNNVSSTVRIRVIAVGNIFYDFSDANFKIQAPTASTFVFNNPPAVAVCTALSGVATLKSAALAGFATTINLSASLNPAGTTVSFGSTSIAPGSSTPVTLNNTNSLAPGTYTVRVTGVAGSVTKTRDLLFTVGTGGTAPTSLTTPANDAIGQSTLPSFNWTAVAGALSYTIEISTSSTFSNIVQTLPNISALPFNLTSRLLENTIYYWRVKTTNSCGAGSPSVIANRFKTGIVSCKMSSDVPIEISDATPVEINSTLTVPASSAVTISDLNVIGLKGSHTYVHDLRFTLISPSGTSVVILDSICDGDHDFDLNLDDSGIPISNAPCPFVSGEVLKPNKSLAAFNGENSVGTWTLKVTDNEEFDGGTLTGWGLNFNSTSTNCVITSTPLTITYTFTGNGNWNEDANWSGSTIPPSPLPANSSIVINHTVGGQCVLNVSQVISAGASLTVLTGKNLVIPGTLTIH
jgi:subtilisin-like proprotein convertase family protein